MVNEAEAVGENTPEVSRLHPRTVGVGSVAFADPSQGSAPWASLIGPASPTHISTSSFARGLGAGLFPAWADSDYGWEFNVSGEAAF